MNEVISYSVADKRSGGCVLPQIRKGNPKGDEVVFHSAIDCCVAIEDSWNPLGWNNNHTDGLFGAITRMAKNLTN